MKKFKLLCLLAIAAWTANARVYYVSPDGDNSDGSSWGKAFRSLLDAQAVITSPADVWVKQGTYNVTDTTLTILNGVNVYGGFSGTESLFAARNADPSLTILNGNKRKRVLTAATNLTVETIWDGFTIQNGNDGNAGGVSLQKNATLQNCIVRNNKNSLNSGGGVYMTTTGADSVKLINCTVTNNVVYYNGTSSSPLGGGGVYIDNGASAAVIRDCRIENNSVNGESFSSAKMYGGGVFMNAGTIENTLVSNNKATSLDPEYGTLTIFGDIHGGGLMIMPPATGNIRVKGCTIQGNIADVKSAGGIIINPYWTGSAVNATVTVENTIIANNYSRANGGGVFCDSQHASSTAGYIFTNCVFANNESGTGQGGGVFINNKAPSTVTFLNSTVANNVMSPDYSGAYNYGGGGIYYNNIFAEVTNCIFWGNQNPGSAAPKHHLRTAGPGGTVSYCAFDSRFNSADITGTNDSPLSIELDNTGAAGNFVKFVRPTGFVGTAKTEAQIAEMANARWALAESSACIDAGATVRTLKFDIVGTARPSGNGYDIGAYEYDPANTSIHAPVGSKLDVYGVTGAIIVRNIAAAERVSVYDVTGKLCKTALLTEGENRLEIAAQGLYIVKTGNNASKVLVR